MGTLTDSDHRLLAFWAAACADHVLHLFESVQPSDARPREAIEEIRAWACGEIRMSQARASGGHAIGTPHLLLARRQWWRMSPHTSLALRRTRSRPCVRRPPDARVRAPAGSSAVGSAKSSRMRFANSSSTISGCETRSAGRSSTVDGLHRFMHLASSRPLLGNWARHPCDGCGKRVERSRSPLAHLRYVQSHRVANQRSERSVVDSFTFADVDCTTCLAV